MVIVAQLKNTENLQKQKIGIFENQTIFHRF